jgi:hypothetical protein
MNLQALAMAIALFLFSSLPVDIAFVCHGQQTELRPSSDETWQQARRRLLNVVSRFSSDSKSRQAIKQMKAAESERELHRCLEPLTLLSVSVNPESRVKIHSLQPKITLRCDRPRMFLIRVENTAGITAPLNLSPIDLAVDPVASAAWCTVEVIESPLTSREFTGALREYKVMQITPHKSGLREVRITGDAGQGTQDLGFRATTDLLLEVSGS